MDIETIKINNKITPYLINSYDGKQHITIFNNNENDLFNDFLTKLISSITSNSTLLKDKSSQVYIYAHNLSTFDGVLILKHLFKFGQVKPLLPNNRLISVNLLISNNRDKITIIFKDSMLLIPSSLRNLCTAFNIPISKGYFHLI